MKKIVRLIRLKKLEKLEKELTVKTLSFIMAAGLLLIIVPFLAIAAGSESPQPDSKGDFRLLNQLFVTTRVTLKGGEENAPRIVAEDVNGVGEISYQWQAFSSNQGSYVNVSAGQSIRISEGLARKYEYEDSKSYFRCLATDEEDNLYVSDVLTVVLPQEQTDDSDTTTGPENSETIATIELLEPTEPTQPDETTTEPEVTTTQPAESTTEPAKETTSPTTAPTQPANDGGKQNDVPEDADPIDGKLLDPITDDEGEDDSAPIRGMLLVPLGDAVNYTVEYYVEKANESGYELFDTRTESAEPGSVIDYTNGHKLYSGSDVNENAYYELSTHPTTYPSDSNVVRILYNRKRYTFTFKYPSYPFRMTNMVYTDGNGQPHTIGHGSTYSFEAKYGQYIESKWPENDAITTKPKNGTITFYFTQVKDTTNNNALIEGNPRYVTNSLVANGQNHTLEFVWSITNPSTTNENKHIYKCYLQEADNNYPSTPYRTYYYPTALSSYPTFEGYGNPQVTQSTSGYFFNRKTTYTLKYPRASYELKIVKPDGTTDVISKKYKDDISGVPNSYPSDYTWFSDPNYTAPYSWTGAKMPYENLTVFAKGTSATHTLLVISKRAGTETTLTEKNEQVAAGDTISAPSLTGWTGYHFTGWYSDAALTDSITFPTTMPNADLTVYAKWEVDTHTLTVKYVDDRGTEEIKGTTTHDYGATVNEPAKSWTGHTFVNWTYADGTAVTWPVTMDSNKTVVAHWTLNSYKLRLYVLGELWREIDVPYNEPLSSYKPEDPEVEGYEFKWWNDENGNVANWNRLMQTSDREFTAEMSPIYYTVTIRKYEGGPVIDTLSVRYGGKVGNNYTAYQSRENYFFNGWKYDDSTHNGAAFEFYDSNVPDSGTLIYSDATVYMDWIPLHTVTFYLFYENGSYSEEYVTLENLLEGNAVSQSQAPQNPDHPERTHAFIAWKYRDASDQEQTFEFGTTEINTDMNVYAVWEEITLTITNGGNDNVFTVSGSGLNLRVFIPAGGSVTLRQIPYGAYTINGEGWDYEKNYSSVTTTVDGSTVTPTNYEFSAVPGVSDLADPFHWLCGGCRCSNDFTGN